MPGKTMMQTPTVENVYVVYDSTGARILETYDFREACVKKRAVRGVLVTARRNVSP